MARVHRTELQNQETCTEVTGNMQKGPSCVHKVSESATGVWRVAGGCKDEGEGGEQCPAVTKVWEYCLFPPVRFWKTYNSQYWTDSQEGLASDMGNS